MKTTFKFGFGVFDGWRQGEVCFSLFRFSFMTSSPKQWSDIVAQSLFGFVTVIRVFRALERLPSVSGAKVMGKRPQFFKELPRKLMGISLINFWLFYQNFGTKTLASPSNSPKTRIVVQNPQKHWATKSARLFDSQGVMTSSKCKQICINILLLCKHQQKKTIFQAKNFFSV